MKIKTLPKSMLLHIITVLLSYQITYYWIAMSVFCFSTYSLKYSCLQSPSLNKVGVSTSSVSKIFVQFVFIWHTESLRSMCEWFVSALTNTPRAFARLPYGCVVKTGTGTCDDVGAMTCSTATYSAGLQYFQCVSQSSEWNQCWCD